jgi:hypothetical protein
MEVKGRLQHAELVDIRIDEEDLPGILRLFSKSHQNGRRLVKA